MLWTSVIDRFQQQRFWAVQWGWTSKTEHGMLHDLEGFPLTIIEHMDFQGDIWIPIQLSELSQTLRNYRKPHNNILAHILAIEDVWFFHGFIDRPSMICSWPVTGVGLVGCWSLNQVFILIPWHDMNDETIRHKQIYAMLMSPLSPWCKFNTLSLLYAFINLPCAVCTWHGRSCSVARNSFI